MNKTDTGCDLKSECLIPAIGTVIGTCEKNIICSFMNCFQKISLWIFIPKTSIWSNKNFEQKMCFFHIAYLGEWKCVDFLWENCWWYLNVLRAHFTSVHIAPIGNNFGIDSANAYAWQNNEHYEFHFDNKSTEALEKLKHDTKWWIKQLIRLFILI